MNLNTIGTDTAMIIVAQVNRELGIDLPAELIAEGKRLDAITHVPINGATPLPPVAALINDALLAGKSPLDNPTVQRHAHIIALSNVDAALDADIEYRRAALLTQHAPAIIEAWAPVIADANTTLTAARNTMPGVDLKDPRAVIGLPTGHLDQWARARDALARVERVAQAWQTLATACHLAPVGPTTAPLMLAALNATQLDELPDRNPTSVALAGHTLNLASPDDFRARCAKIDTEHGERQARRAREMRTGVDEADVLRR